MELMADATGRAGVGEEWKKNSQLFGASHPSRRRRVQHHGTSSSALCPYDNTQSKEESCPSKRSGGAGRKEHGSISAGLEQGVPPPSVFSGPPLLSSPGKSHVGIV